MKKHILIALPTDILGGAESFLKSMALAYSSRGYEVYVFFITSRQTEGWEDLKYKINLIYGRGFSERKGFPHLLKNLIKVRNVSFQFAFSSHVHITGVIGFLRRIKVLKIEKFIGRESTSIFTRFTGIRLWEFKLLYQMGYPTLDLLICQTSFMKNQFEKGIPSVSKKIKRIEVFPNPINLNNSVINSEKEPEIFVETNKNYIVSAGRLIYEKGFDLLIKAFQPIFKQDNNLRLLILGDGNLRADLELLIKKLELTDKVFMPGRVKNVYPYFKNARLCIVSSRVEGFPNVLLQMMSLNGNVISSTCAGDIDTIPQLPTFEPDKLEVMQKAINENLYSDQNVITQRYFSFQNFLKERSIEGFIKKLEVI